MNLPIETPPSGEEDAIRKITDLLRDKMRREDPPPSRIWLPRPDDIEEYATPNCHEDPVANEAKEL